MTGPVVDRTVLLTLGRLPKALEVARALHSAGCRVVVAEPFRRHLTGASRQVARSVQVTSPVIDREAYLGELTALAVAEGVSLILPVSEEILHVSLLHGRMPAGVRLAAMPHPTLLALHDKLSFTEVCRAAGVAAPETFDLDDPQALQLAAAVPTVVKPVFSCSGRGVRFLSPGDALPRYDERAVVQRRCDGRLLSTFTLARAGEQRRARRPRLRAHERQLRRLADVLDLAADPLPEGLEAGPGAGDGVAEGCCGGKGGGGGR
jgi:hypothetical protein